MININVLSKKLNIVKLNALIGLFGISILIKTYFSTLDTDKMYVEQSMTLQNLTPTDNEPIAIR